MRALAVKCPHCAARLEVAETATTASCSYCGTTSRIQARTRFLERAVPPAALPPEAKNFPVATQPHSARWLLVVILVPLMIGGAVLSRMAVTGGGPFEKDYLWQSPGVAVADLSGDGSPDLAGWIQPIPGEKLYLAAFAGASGKRLWRREIGTHQETGLIAVAGDLVLHAEPRGRVEAFAAADGSPRWETAMGETVEAFCAGEGVALARTRDQRWHRLDLAEGSRAAAEEPSPCVALPNDRSIGRQPKGAEYHPGIVRVGVSYREVPGPDKLEGMYVGGLAVLEGGARVALGYKSPGTRVPMLARYEVEGLDPSWGEWPDLSYSERQEVRFPVAWMVEVPGQDPLSAREGSLEHVAAAGSRVYAAYRMAQGPPRVTAFDLETGSRLFEVALPEGSEDDIGFLVAVGGQVFIKNRWGLLALDPQSGAVAYRLGR